MLRVELTWPFRMVWSLVGVISLGIGKLFSMILGLILAAAGVALRLHHHRCRRGHPASSCWASRCSSAPCFGAGRARALQRLPSGSGSERQTLRKFET